MTETTAPTSPRLERPRDGGIAGVSAALARTTGTSIVLWRVLFLVLALFDGLGVALYFLGVVTIAKEGEAQSLGARLVHGPDRRLTAGNVLVLVLMVLSAGSLLDDGDGLLVVLVLSTLAVLWWQRRDPSAPYDGPLDAPTDALAPRRRRRFGRFVAAFVALVVVVVLSVFATLVAQPALDDGAGDRTWRPTGDATYRLGVGEATLDLRDIPQAETTPVEVDARVTYGHLVVLVPDDVRVELDAAASFGELLLLGRDQHGRRVSEVTTIGPGDTDVRLRLRVRGGQVEVRNG